MPLRHSLSRLTLALLFAGSVIAGGGAAGLYDYAYTDQSREPTYGELARSTYPVFEEMVAGVRRFGATTLPHEAKVLRRVIGDVWYLLDIFAYAYPANGNDLLLQLLPSVKRGYDRMGDFKDLFDRQLSRGVQSESVTYNESELKSLRDSVLEWRRETLQPEKLQAYRTYLRSPSNENVFSRPKSSLSECYWGGVTAVPSKDQTGIQNLRVLMLGLAEKLQREYQQIDHIERLLEGHNHEVFHDFRVHVRCALSIVHYFPPLTAGIPSAGAIEQRLKDLVAKYGDLNDTIMAFNAANSKGQKSRAEALRRTISTEWSEIKKWQRKSRIHDQLEEYGDLLKLAVRKQK